MIALQLCSSTPLLFIKAGSVASRSVARGEDPDWKMNSLLVGQPGYMRGHAVGHLSAALAAEGGPVVAFPVIRLAGWWLGGGCGWFIPA